MKNGAKIAIVVLLAVAATATFALRGGKRAEYGAAPEQPAAVAAPRAVAATVKPRLLEIGSSRCMSCIEMAKVLDALRASQGEKLKVDFVDVFEQPEAGERYKITLIPTQIFYDTAGREIFRHTGYFAHDDILAKFRELGVKM